VLIDEDFRTPYEKKLALPEGWEGDAFRVGKENELYYTEVSRSSEVHFAKLPPLTLSGNFSIEGVYYLDQPHQSLTLSLENRARSTVLPIVFSWDGRVVIDKDDRLPPQGYKPLKPTQFLVQRQGKKLHILLHKEFPVDKNLEEVAEFDTLRLGLSAGIGWTNRLARLYGLKVSLLPARAPQPPRSHVEEEVAPNPPPVVPPTTKPKPRDDGPMVDAGGSGRFRTIKGALDYAPPNSVITIKEGTYKEALVLDKPVRLMPWKQGEKVEVLAPQGSVALTVACDGCVVRNLTLRGEVGPGKRGNRRRPLVLITQGSPEVDGCDIGWVEAARRGNDAGACVEVRGAGARPTLIGCHLHNGWQGLYIVEGARPVVEDCKVFDNAVGVWVEKAGGRLTKCTVRRSRAANVSVTGKGTQVDLNGGEIFDSGGGGVVVIEGGKLKLSACKIHHNKGPAFEVRGTDSLLDASDCKGADVHDNNPGGKPWEFDDEKTFRPPSGVAQKETPPVIQPGHRARRPELLDCTGGISAAEVRQAQEEWAKYLARPVEETVEIGDGVNMTFVLVPPGKFLMGSPGEEIDRTNDEAQHEVTLTEPFDLSETEVTQAQYQALGLENPSRFKGDDRPVEQVSWTEAREWAEKLTKKRGVKYLYRLPTEAEWEYACRGGHPSSQPFGIGDGQKLSSHQANFNGDSPYGGAEKGPFLQTTLRVANYLTNAMGLYDMHGNVWEWCQDWYGAYPRSAVTNPTGPERGSARVNRSGSWSGGAADCRASRRSGTRPSTRSYGLGFRVARSAKTPAQPIEPE
jgi:formylglycine-generating enzyme required for sulfatase activity